MDHTEESSGFAIRFRNNPKVIWEVTLVEVVSFPEDGELATVRRFGNLQEQSVPKAELTILPRKPISLRDALSLIF